MYRNRTTLFSHENKLRNLAGDLSKNCKSKSSKTNNKISFFKAWERVTYYILFIVQQWADNSPFLFNYAACLAVCTSCKVDYSPDLTYLLTAGHNCKLLRLLFEQFFHLKKRCHKYVPKNLELSWNIYDIAIVECYYLSTEEWAKSKSYILSDCHNLHSLNY